MTTVGQAVCSTTNNLIGGKVYRTANGVDWSQVSLDGFGVISNTTAMLGDVYYMFTDGQFFYVGTGNQTTGTELWRTPNGLTWTQYGLDGFGNSNNSMLVSGAKFKDSVYLGTWDRVNANGGEIWQMLHQVYLPFTKK
jgi:hypothetical protein